MREDHTPDDKRGPQQGRAAAEHSQSAQPARRDPQHLRSRRAFMSFGRHPGNISIPQLRLRCVRRLLRSRNRPESEGRRTSQWRRDPRRAMGYRIRGAARLGVEAAGDGAGNERPGRFSGSATQATPLPSPPTNASSRAVSLGRDSRAIRVFAAAAVGPATSWHQFSDFGIPEARFTPFAASFQLDADPA